MNYRFPRLSGRQVREVNAVRTPSPNASGRSLPETQFLRTWFEYESDCELDRSSHWGKLLGMAVVLGVSGSFWVGFGLLVSYLAR